LNNQFNLLSLNPPKWGKNLSKTMTFGGALLFVVAFLGIILMPVTLFFLQFYHAPTVKKEGWHEHRPQSRHKWLIKTESAFFGFLLLGILFLMYLMSQAEVQDPAMQPWMILVYALFSGLGLFIIWVLYHTYRLYRVYHAYEKDSQLLINYQERCIQYIRGNAVYELKKGEIRSLTYFCYTTVWRRSPLTEFERYVFELNGDERIMITNWVLDVNSHVLDDTLGIQPGQTVTGIKGLYI